MSVTFTAEMGAAVAYVITCSCDDATSHAAEYDSYDTAREALLAIPYALEYRAGEHRTPLVGCSEPELCTQYPLRVRAIEDLDRPLIDVSRANARFILENLGYTETVGEAAPEDFLGRVHLGLALAPHDEGVPSYQDGWLIHCGRRSGYLQEHLGKLLDLASWCLLHDRTVQWH